MKGMDRVSRGGSFGGLAKYLLENGRGKIIGGNMSGRTPRELAREFGQVRRLREDVEKPVWHQSLRLPKGEHVDSAMLAAIADRYMEEMGFTDLHQRVYGEHDDEDGQHVHIEANRIDAEGNLYLGQNENLRSTRIIQKLEREFGLTITKGPEIDHDGKTVMPDRSRLKKGEIELALADGEKPRKLQLQDAIDRAAEGRPPVMEFVARLEAQGVRSIPNVASTGKMNGFSFEMGGVAFKASQLGQAYKWSQLEKRIDYEQIRDSPALAGHRSEVTRAVADRSAEASRGSGGHAGQPDVALGREHDRVGQRSEAADQAANRAGIEARQAIERAGSIDESGHSRASEDRRGGVGERENSAELGEVGGENAVGDHAARDRGSRTMQRSEQRSSASINDLAAPVVSMERLKEGKPMTAAEEMKRSAWRRQHDALQAEKYRVTLVGRKEGLPPGWNLCNVKQPDGSKVERLWTAQEVENRISHLQRKNAEGFDVYITPVDSRKHYMVVDDMTPEKEQGLKTKGYEPSLIQESSKGNRQAILIVDKVARPDEQSLANGVVQDLNQRFGDPKFSGVEHPFRMAGFSNKKPGRDNAFTKIVEVYPERRCKKATIELSQQRQAAVKRELENERQGRIKRIADYQVVQVQEASGNDKYADIYKRTARGLQKHFGVAADWSSIDYRCGIAIARAGGSRSDIEAAIKKNSPQLSGRHPDTARYASLTAEKVEMTKEVQAARQEQARQAAVEAQRQATLEADRKQRHGHYHQMER